MAWSVSREIRTAPSSNGSAGDRTGGGGRCRLSRRPNPDRGLRVAALGPGLWEVPSWGHRAVRTSPGGPPGPSPPRRRYRSRHLREFPVSPHFGRERSGRSGNTARPQRFSRNKEADGQPSLSHRPRREKAHPSSPARSLRGRGSMSRFQPRGPTRRHLVADQLAKGPQSSLHQPSDANGAAGEPLTPRQGVPGSRNPPDLTQVALPGSAPCVPTAGGRTHKAGAARTWLHLPLLPAQPGRPGPPLLPGSPAQRTRRARHSPAALRGSSPPLTPSTSCFSSASSGVRFFLGPARSPRPSPALALILGGGVRAPRATPPSAGPRSPRTEGGDGPERLSRAGLVGPKAARGGVSSRESPARAPGETRRELGGRLHPRRAV